MKVTWRTVAVLAALVVCAFAPSAVASTGTSQAGHGGTSSVVQTKLSAAKKASVAPKGTSATKSTFTPPVATPASASARGDTLPFTGIDLMLAFAGGTALVLVGLAMRRQGREQG